jgi:hypothetical protein
MSGSFKASLISYLKGSGLTADQRAHLKRWAADDRAEEVWQSIERGARENKKLPLPAGFFIGEILGAKRVAMSIGRRRILKRKFRLGSDYRRGKLFNVPELFPIRKAIAPY